VMVPYGCANRPLLYHVGGPALREKRNSFSPDGNDLAAMSDGERTKLRRAKIGSSFSASICCHYDGERPNIAIAQYITATVDPLV